MYVCSVYVFMAGSHYVALALQNSHTIDQTGLPASTSHMLELKARTTTPDHEIHFLRYGQILVIFGCSPLNSLDLFS